MGKLPVLKEKPALIVWGMRYFAFRAKELKQCEAIFPNSQTVRLSSVGHFVQEEAPDELYSGVIGIHEDPRIELIPCRQLTVSVE